MATTVTLNGTSYSIPSASERNWASLSTYLIAISTGVLTKAGGSFTLTAEVDLGATYGLKSAYYKSRGTNIAAAGVARLANAESVSWRNAANSADKALKVNSSDRLEFDSVNVPTISSTDTLTNKTLTSPVINTPTGITKSDVGLGNVDNTSDATKNAATATLTNKTLSGNTATNLISGSGTLTLNTTGTITVPNATDTLVGKATTDTLTNKTLTSPVINTPTGIVKGDVGLGNVDNTSDATKDAATATLTNKTLTSPTINSPIINTPTIDVATIDGQAAAPSNPSAGFYKTYVSDSDGKLHVRDSSGNDSAVGSGSSGRNYLGEWFDGVKSVGSVTSGITATGDITISTTTWQASDTSKLTLANLTSGGLRETKSFKLDHVAVGAAFIQSPNFTLDLVDLGKPVMVSFDVGTVAASDDYQVVMVRYNSSGTYQEQIVIAGTASATTPYSARIPAGSVTSFNGFFIASSDSSDYYALRFVRNSASDTTDVTIDSLKVSPEQVIQGAAVTDWQSYTPIITNLPTSATSFFWKRIGDNMQVWGKATASGAATGIIDVSIPSGYSIDTSKLFSTGGNDSAVLGIAEAQDTGTAYYKDQISYDSTTAVRILSTTASNYWRNAVPHTWASTDTLTVNFTVPIVGWSSSVAIANRAVEEYAATGGTWDAASSTTVYGVTGQAMGGALTASRTKTITFQTPIQSTDSIHLEGSNDGKFWTPLIGSTIGGVVIGFGFDSGASFSFGARFGTATTNSIEVIFAVYANQANDDAPIVNWPSSGAYWRVRKVSGGASVGFPVSARNIVGDVSGTAVPSGYIGETIESSSTGTGKTLTNNTYVTFSNNTLGGVAGGVVLTPGKWSLTFSVTIEGSNTANYYTVAISTSTGSVTPNAYGGENVFDILHHTPVSGIINKITIANFIVNLSTTTNYYGIVSASNNPTPNSSRGRLTAIRIA